jgi:hypothetical protein
MEERVRLSSNGHFSTPERILCTHLIGGMLVPIALLNTGEEIISFPYGESNIFPIF